MQAQNDLGMLVGQMKAGEEGSKKQVEWYEQQAQQVQAAPPGYYQGQQPMQLGQPPFQQGPYPPQQAQPQMQPQAYQPPPQQFYQPQQAYPQPAQPHQQYYVPVYQVDPQGYAQGSGQPRQEDKSECIIS